jgi:flagellar biosynthesis/type III secretory pathway M-ring protein FliF/YscJ
MAIIGFLLLAAAAVFGVELAYENNFSIEIDAFNQVYSSSVAMMFVAGVVTALVGVLGVLLIRDGMIRRRRVRAEAREAEQVRERHIAALEEEHAAHHRAEATAPARETQDGRDGEAIDLRDRERQPDHEHVTTF